jgi:thiamine biosynthesis lipoprotein
MELFTYPFQAMGGPCQIKLYAVDKVLAKKAAISAISEIERLGSKYSRYREGSVINEFNACAHRGIHLDDETALLVNYADQLFNQSEGMFDVTSGLLRKAWNFKAKTLPDQQEIDAILPFIGWHKIEWDGLFLKFPVEGMQFDFGGFVKEYAADAAANICRNHGILNGLVELGGDISIIGPAINSSPWPIGIRDPRDPDNLISRINLLNGGLASSGDYERYFIAEGKRYGHILNPLTGWPIEGFSSISVIADHCLLAGSLPTIALLKGEHLGLQWLKSTAEFYFCVRQNGDTHSSDSWLLA